MRRYALIVIVLLLALLAGPIQIARSMPNNGPDSAARAQMDPVALARLGRYLRPDALLYAAVRTDPASFAQLDRVMARFQAALPPGALDPGLPLRVESLLSELIGLDFTRLVRPWMGDVAALAIYPQDALVGAEWRYGSSDYPVMAAIAITDRNVAAAFVEQNAAGWTRTDRAGYTVFMPQDEYNHSGILIRDDVLIIASYADLLPLDGPPAFSLTHSRTFNKTIALLPGSSYNALMYVDLPMLIAQAVGDDYDVQPEARVLINAVLRMIGPEAAGMTVGDERGIVIDVVQPVGNIAALEALDLAFGPGTPVDPAFVTALPGTAALVLHGANPGAIYDMARQAAGALAGGGLLQAPVTDSIFRPFEAVFGALTGLNYERDLVHWLSGDFAAFAGYNPLFNINMPMGAANLPLDAGIVFETNDPAATQEFLFRLERELQMALRIHNIEDITIREDVINGLPAVVATITDYDGTPELEVLAASNGSLVVFGTRGAVTSVLVPTGARFLPAQQYALPNAEMALYASMSGLVPLINLLEQSGTSSDEIEALRVLAGFADTATVTVSSLPDGGIVLRFALTTRP